MNVLFSFKNKKLIVLICANYHVCKNLFTLTCLGKMQVLALIVSHD